LKSSIFYRSTSSQNLCKVDDLYIIFRRCDSELNRVFGFMIAQRQL